MNTPKKSAAEPAQIPPLDWPNSMVEEWCCMHRLIDELSSIQHRLGTPLEKPEDFLKIRGLGSNIQEKLDTLGPWIQEAWQYREQDSFL